MKIKDQKIENEKIVKPLGWRKISKSEIKQVD